MAVDQARNRYPRWMRVLGLVRRVVLPTGMAPQERVRKWAVALYVIVVLALIAGLLPEVRTTIGCLLDSACPGGLERVAVNGRTEYVGVTDKYPFRPEFAHAMAVLRRENAYATQGGPGTYTTVAQAGPLTADEPRMLHRIEGAIAGQHDANHSGLVGDRPRIRLTLGNMDPGEQHWKVVADDLRDAVYDDENLRAVAGMGLSQAETVDAMNELRRIPVPTVSDMITSATINAGSQGPFVRVGPDTGQQLDVLGRYMKPRLAHHKAMLVVYSKQTDLYTQALKSGFLSHLGGSWTAGGKVIAPFGDAPGNEFPQIVRILCGSRGIDTIYYAGRAADLPLFLTDLGDRVGCSPGKITVISTSDTSRLLVKSQANERAWNAMRGTTNPIELIYTPLAETSLLATAPGSRQPYAATRKLFTQLGFDPAHLDTGWGVMAHDSVLTAAQAIRTAAGNSGKVPPPSTVAGMLRLMNASTTSVPGASGPIRLDPTTGDRYDLRIPVLRFVPRKPSKVLGVYRPSTP